MAAEAPEKSRTVSLSECPAAQPDPGLLQGPREEAKRILWPAVPALPGSESQVRRGQPSTEVKLRTSPRAGSGPSRKQASMPQTLRVDRSEQPSSRLESAQDHGTRRWRSAARGQSPDGGKLSRGYLNRLMAKTVRTSRHSSAPWAATARTPTEWGGCGGQGPLPSPRASLLARQKSGAPSVANAPSLTLPNMGRPAQEGSVSPPPRKPAVDQMGAAPLSRISPKPRQDSLLTAHQFSFY
eukprot:s741_g18.t1